MIGPSWKTKLRFNYRYTSKYTITGNTHQKIFEKECFSQNPNISAILWYYCAVTQDCWSLSDTRLWVPEGTDLYLRIPWVTAGGSRHACLWATGYLLKIDSNQKTNFKLKNKVLQETSALNHWKINKFLLTKRYWHLLYQFSSFRTNKVFN